MNNREHQQQMSSLVVHMTYMYTLINFERLLKVGLWFIFNFLCQREVGVLENINMVTSCEKVKFRLLWICILIFFNLMRVSPYSRHGNKKSFWIVYRYLRTSDCGVFQVRTTTRCRDLSVGSGLLWRKWTTRKDKIW